jgi:hypothetical protein
MPEGKDYCERKINLLKSNFDQLVEVIYSSGSKFDFDISICAGCFQCYAIT